VPDSEHTRAGVKTAPASSGDPGPRPTPGVKTKLPSTGALTVPAVRKTEPGPAVIASTGAASKTTATAVAPTTKTLVASAGSQQKASDWRTSDTTEDRTPKTTDAKPGPRKTLSTQTLKRRIETACGKQANVTQVALLPNGHLAIEVRVHSERETDSVSTRIFGISDLAPYHVDLKVTIEP